MPKLAQEWLEAAQLNLVSWQPIGTSAAIIVVTLLGPEDPETFQPLKIH